MQVSSRRKRVTSESKTTYLPLIIDTGDPNTDYKNLESSFDRNVSVVNRHKIVGSCSDNMSKDRTLEFANAIQSLQTRHINRAIAIRDVKKVQTLQSYSEFMSLAKFVGSNIVHTYSKLEKLTLLAKQKSLFNDSSTEIQELSYIIKEDLKSLNEQLCRLQNISKDQNVANRSGRHHLISHSNSVVSALQSKVISMSNEFKTVLDMRTENMKQTKTRRDQFTKRDLSLTVSSRSSQASQFHNSLLFNENISEDQALLPSGSRAQTQLLIQDETQSYLESRADTMQNIESTIVELGGIFQQLAHMVKEQDEMVQRIDANVYDVEMNVEAAHHQILRYFQSVTSNRWLMIKIFAVLMFFFTFFVVFLT